jgi:hypothetical protein
MTDTDELDRIWREGLGHLAAPTTPISDPASAVGARARQRHQSRIGVLATAAVVIAVSIAGVLVVAGRRSTETIVPARSPTSIPRRLVVDVIDAARGNLAISFPGRKVSGSPPHVNLPAGLTQLKITTLTAGHSLVLDGVPAFAATPQAIGTVIRTVQLVPGVYALHCIVPGHTEAGEEMLLDVG